MDSSDYIQEMVRQLELSSDGDLPFWSRLRLWSLLADEFPDARIRRSLLSYKVAGALLESWQSEWAEDQFKQAPLDMYITARTALEQDAAESGPNGLSQHWRRRVDEVVEFWEDAGDVVFCYPGLCALLDRVSGKDDKDYNINGLYDTSWSSELDVRPTELSVDHALWDVSFYVSIVKSNGAPWEIERSDPDSRRVFWNEWLTVTVPAFTGAIEKAWRSSGLRLQ